MVAVVGTSKGRKTIHIDMERQIFAKQMFAEPSSTMEPREDFHQMIKALLGSFLSITLY